MLVKCSKSPAILAMASCIACDNFVHCNRIMSLMVSLSMFEGGSQISQFGFCCASIGYG